MVDEEGEAFEALVSEFRQYIKDSEEFKSDVKKFVQYISQLGKHHNDLLHMHHDAILSQGNQIKAIQETVSSLGGDDLIRELERYGTGQEQVERPSQGTSGDELDRRKEEGRDS